MFDVPPDAVKKVIFGMKVSPAKSAEVKKKVLAITPHVIFKNASLNHLGEFNVA